MIDPSAFWNNILLLAIGTIAIRGSIIAISSRVQITERWKELFLYIPAAILPAFIAPAVFFHHGSVGALMGKERFVVLVLATGVCYRVRNTFVTIAFGLIALYALTAS
jgi:branched-subunit amino acid transport protein